jgi:DMSO/TMAO reductase YedYZ molybdopterin-dependent catalytic subunit
MRRREFLGWSAAALAWSRVARAGQTLLQHVTRPAQNWATPIEYFDRLITPTAVFFVRSHFGPPALKRDRTLSIGGMVDHPLTVAVADLRAFAEISVTGVLQCAGNGRALHEPRVPGVQWEHGAMGQATWTGVRLRDLLQKAGVQAGAAHVRVLGADWPPQPTVPRFIRSIPLARALDPSTIVAWRMNGEPLSLAHGAPLRLIVPGWTGNHWVKWLTDIRVQKEEAEGFYYQTGYRIPKQPGAPGQPVAPAEMRPVTSFPVRSVIARPADGGRAPVGTQEIVGVAMSGDAAIAKVEISLDGGKSFAEATLEGEGGVGRWVVFKYRFEASTPGAQRALARATDRVGAIQPERALWNPSGYLWNGWHAVSWTVHA